MVHNFPVLQDALWVVSHDAVFKGLIHPLLKCFVTHSHWLKIFEMRVYAYAEIFYWVIVVDFVVSKVAPFP